MTMNTTALTTTAAATATATATTIRFTEKQQANEIIHTFTNTHKRTLIFKTEIEITTIIK